MPHPENCHDCGVSEGQRHESGCDMEICPFCGHQLIGCRCCYHLLHIDISVGSFAYSHGLTDEQARQWHVMLTAKGLIPYVRIPVLCRLCGKNIDHGMLFDLTDEEWQKHVIPPLQKEVLCRECYDRQVVLFPTGWLAL